MIITYHLLFILKLLAALGCGLMAGVFFAFSVFVMSALARLQPPQGIAAMQSINLTAIAPLFMAVLFGTAAICIFLAIASLSMLSQSNTPYLILGSLLYLIGTVLVTIAFNVPLNNALAKVEPNSPSGASLWADYLITWTNWNHLRTITSLAAAAMFAIALCNQSVN
jgi:uncharacterized membrane protein